MMRYLKGLAAIVAVFGVAQAGAAHAGAARTQAAEAQRFVGVYSAAPCPGHFPATGVACGRLDVPENWSKPKGRRIGLAVAVIKAKAPGAGPAKAPVLFITGGPGYSAFAVIQYLFATPINAQRDVIVVEPRGFGFSDPALVCRGRFEELAACRARFVAAGVDVDQYNTTNLAHDLEALRNGMGVAKWNVLGVSYGTNLALNYARLHPGGIEAQVLDSPYPPQAGYDWTRPSALNAFQRVFEACKADPACDAAYPDLRRRFIAGLRRAEAEKPIVNGKRIGGGEVFAEVYHQLYMSPTLNQAPYLSDLAARGDYASLLTPPASTPGAIDPDKAFAGGLNAAIECADDIPFKGAPDARAPFYSPWPKDIVDMIRPEGWNYAQICAAWPAKSLNPRIKDPVRSELPTLILVGAMDPITPVQFAEAAALTLPNATIAVDPQASHAVFLTGHACVWRLVFAFLDDPKETLDTSCLAETPKVAWRLPAR